MYIRTTNSIRVSDSVKRGEPSVCGNWSISRDWDFRNYEFSFPFGEWWWNNAHFYRAFLSLWLVNRSSHVLKTEALNVSIIPITVIGDRDSYWWILCRIGWVQTVKVLVLPVRSCRNWEHWYEGMDIEWIVLWAEGDVFLFLSWPRNNWSGPWSAPREYETLMPIGTDVGGHAGISKNESTEALPLGSWISMWRRPDGLRG